MPSAIDRSGIAGAGPVSIPDAGGKIDVTGDI
jgi:hypothetical protein